MKLLLIFLFISLNIFSQTKLKRQCFDIDTNFLGKQKLSIFMSDKELSDSISYNFETKKDTEIVSSNLIVLDKCNYCILKKYWFVKGICVKFKILYVSVLDQKRKWYSLVYTITKQYDK